MKEERSETCGDRLPVIATSGIHDAMQAPAASANHRPRIMSRTQVSIDALRWADPHTYRAPTSTDLENT